MQQAVHEMLGEDYHPERLLQPEDVAAAADPRYLISSRLVTSFRFTALIWQRCYIERKLPSDCPLFTEKEAAFPVQGKIWLDNYNE